MEDKKTVLGMLDLMLCPGFCVQNNQIMKVNQAAQSLLLTPGTDIRPLLVTGKEEYQHFSQGCLYLTLKLSGQIHSVCVSRMGDMDVFVLEQDPEGSELQALALAARDLRQPLSTVMITADRLLAQKKASDPQTLQQIARLNRGLLQMLRIISNMSDADRCRRVSHQETRDVTALTGEIFEKAQALVSQAGITLTYEGPSCPILMLVDGEQLERAILNILSNAMKFTPEGGSIHASLSQIGRMLRLSIQDTGTGIDDHVRSTIFSRYLRQPAIEDGRFGIGIGMVLIRSAAANHGGTVLIDQPEGQGARVTMTMAIRQSSDTTLRSGTLRVDYTGERDHALIELSESLPLSLYEKS